MIQSREFGVQILNEMESVVHHYAHTTRKEILKTIRANIGSVCDFRMSAKTLSRSDALRPKL